MSSIEINEEEETQNSYGAVYIKNPLKRRKCPLCRQNLFLYNLNYEEMMLMCENNDCDYPFGYEALQIVRDESELRDKPLPATDSFYMYPTEEPTTIDTISTASFMPTHSVTSELDSDFAVEEICEDSLTQYPRRRKQKSKIKNKQIEENLKSIKQLNEEMTQLSNDFDKQITSEKWLHNLKSWELCSGKKLLKEEELSIIKQDKPLHMDDLTISYDPGVSVATVSIELKPECKEQ